MTKFTKRTESSLKIISIQFLEIILVILCMVLSFAVAGFLIYGGNYPFHFQQGILFFLMVSGIAIIILSSFRYFNFVGYSFASTMGKSMFMVFSINVVFVLLLYFFTSSRLSPYYFIVAAALQYSFLLLIKIFSGILKRNIINQKVALIIGKSKDRQWLMETIQKKCDYHLTFIDESDKACLHSIDQSDFVYLVSSATKEFKQRIITYCELQCKRLFIVPEVHEIAMRDSELSRVGDIPLFTIDQFRMTEGQAIIKRMVDIVLSFFGILASVPLILIFAILIKAEDGGPVFYRQTRSGIHGKDFQIWKLRSMIVDAEKNTGTVCATENDDRITKIGKVMRRYRIDEMPQFLNVLAGSMSIVGPRPERPYYIKKFCSVNPEFNLRLAVKPGITGLAQVMANYTTTPENKLKFDLFYIKSYSPLLDFRILLKTILAVFQRSQSQGFDEDCGETIGEKKTKQFCVGGGRKRYYSWLKAAITVLACAAIVASATLMRYGPLIEQLRMIMVEGNPTGVTIEEQAVPLSNEAAVSATLRGISFLENPEGGWQESWNLLFGLILKMEASDLAELEGMAADGFTEEELLKTKELLSMQRR